MSNFPAGNILGDVNVTELTFRTEIENFLSATKELLGANAPVNVTIATGSVTPPNEYGGVIVVDTENSAATDDLTNIIQTNIPEGRWLLVKSTDPTRTVVIKNLAGGSGQISTTDGLDFSLDNNDKWILLRREGNLWVELTRGYGSDKAAARTNLGVPSIPAAISEGGTGATDAATARINLAVPGLSSDNAYTGRQKWSKGSDIASASTITIPSDGNSFTVTGTTNISAINSVQPGTFILLRFANSLTLINNLTSLILPGGTDLTVSANDLLLLYEYSAGNWQAVHYEPYNTSTSSIAVASIAGFMISVPPSGWLECNGAAISRIAYSDLFSAIGVTYGAGDGSTTFNLPDLRGRFLRGWDHGKGLDPDATSRLDRGDGTVGDAVGTLQADQFKSHRHSVEWSATASTTSYAFYGGLNSGVFSRYSRYAGGNETRPTNINVMWCIKY